MIGKRKKQGFSDKQRLTQLCIYNLLINFVYL